MLIKKSYIAALHDTCMAAFSFAVALYLRLGNSLLLEYKHFIPSVLLFTGVCAVVFSLAGLYRGVWRYASLQDLFSITRAVTIATLVFVPLLFMLTRLESFPRSVLVINWMVLLACLGGPRLLYRMAKDKSLSINFLRSSEDSRIPVLLVGVGDSAINFIRETSHRSSSEYRVIGLVDESRETHGRQIHGIKVYGGFGNIPKIIRKLKKSGNAPRRIILANDNIDGSVIKELLKITDTLGFSLAKLPKMSDFKENVDKIEVKPVAIEDLLGRAQKAPDLGRRKGLIEGRAVLVTGAGGTIGSELVRQISAYRPSRLVLFEISEFNLYKISMELAESFPGLSVRALIGDVRDFAALDNLFAEEKPELVFHAAALKHVPIVEENLCEAALTNIIGSKNVADCSVKHNARKVVMVSTDKAVNPTSLMGVTKRVAECYVQGLGASGNTGVTTFSTVRFGNVLGSSGSVIPLFQKQLEAGGPITVTHPEMTRYFMTVPEAVELVLQASTLENDNGKSAIFVLDMGEPMLIKDLAIQMIKLAGFRPDTDIKIEYTGIRPGEKLYEELFYDNEAHEKTRYEGITFARARDIDFASISAAVTAINAASSSRNEGALLELLKAQVPEYNPNPELTKNVA